MRITVFLFLFSVLFAQASIGYSQSTELKIRLKSASIQEILNEIEKESDYRFVFDSNTKKIVDKTVTLSNNALSIEEILREVLSNTNLAYKILDNQIVIYRDETKKVTEDISSLISEIITQQKQQVSGRITDQNGEAIIGANIIEVGTTNGTVTDIDGNFSIGVEENAFLNISYIGYLEQTINTSGRNNINIVLTEDTKALDELIVIGYGSVRRGDVTTAVSTVSLDDLNERPIVSAAQAIQGKAAGVNVYRPSGTPGGEIVVRVRGTTSFNGSNDPLYVVDGVPVDNINFLSPTDISGIQILKDASSAAIYGSRAANGVVLITTRQASGEAKISANIQMGVSRVSNPIESLNASQYKDLIDELRPGAIPEGITDKTDWFKEVYGTGITQNYQLQVSDGNERLRYFISGGYLDEQGVLSSAFFKRFNFRTNVESQIRSWLHFGVNVSYSDNTSNGVTTGQGSNRGGVVLAVVNLPTSATIINEQSGLYNRLFYGQNIANPIEEIENGKNNKNNENRLIGSANATITFMPELNLKSTFTLDRRNGNNTGFTPPSHGADRNDWGNAWDTRNMNSLLVFDNVLTYKNTFAEKHNFEAMAGTSWTDSQWSQSYINGSHFKDGSIKTLNAANKIGWDNTGSSASQWGIFSMFGRLSYNYESKYLFTFNIREDGSTKLHPDHRWGTFPSMSAAWRLSSEGFMQDIDWVDDLKVRGGWGQTGNQSGIGDFAYLQRYNIARQAWFETGKEDSLPLITQANLRTSDLTWETTNQYNIGVDATLFSNR
ncbi:MAG: SusC/RagA family TonB-linked outer membrane protein, partial [Bacteroidales bacterium]|nr:SusC/RagA family TonB-linked outer membrane protein [Bacteroidales bacterium]